eukprot:scpid84576/ scgid8854/ 
MADAGKCHPCSSCILSGEKPHYLILKEKLNGSTLYVMRTVGTDGTNGKLYAVPYATGMPKIPEGAFYVDTRILSYDDSYKEDETHVVFQGNQKGEERSIYFIGNKMVHVTDSDSDSDSNSYKWTWDVEMITTEPYPITPDEALCTPGFFYLPSSSGVLQCLAFPEALLCVSTTLVHFSPSDHGYGFPLIIRSKAEAIKKGYAYQFSYVEKVNSE